MEVVTNSFGNIRVFSGHAGGNVGGPTSIGGLADSDTLNLLLNYDLGSDTFDVSYGLNGGAMTNLATYTGAGNFYGNVTDVQVFKFGDNDGPATILLDNFNVTAPIPEPSSAALFAACFGLAAFRRRR